jgi:hypothetical protein
MASQIPPRPWTTISHRRKKFDHLMKKPRETAMKWAAEFKLAETSHKPSLLRSLCSERNLSLIESMVNCEFCPEKHSPFRADDNSGLISLFPLILIRSFCWYPPLATNRIISKSSGLLSRSHVGSTAPFQVGQHSMSDERWEAFAPLQTLMAHCHCIAHKNLEKCVGTLNEVAV